MLRPAVAVICVCVATTVPVISRASDASASEPPIEGLRIAKPLVAHWTFDEQVGSTCHDASPNGYDALPEAAPPGALRRVEGVFGGALSLSGQHLLRTRKKLDLARLARITFSAWVVPVEMGKYSEIFRKEDGDHRVLFSFQDDGTHLSLGLNIGGYVECDASIRPQMVLDGRWHHCAATFDGRCMRVYLDGQEIGSLARPGSISAGGEAPGCIGSSEGGECFQGSLDDLRIYSEALSSGEIGRLYESGLDSLARGFKKAEARLAAVFVPGKTFAESLAGTRRNCASAGYCSTATSPLRSSPASS